MTEVLLIGDQKVKAIPVQDCGNPMVDLQIEFPNLLFDLARNHVQKESKSISFGRRQVGEMLCNAQKSLPSDIRFLVKECFRPLWIQKKFFEGYSRHLRSKYPDWSEDKIYIECSKLNAPVDVAPHTPRGEAPCNIFIGRRFLAQYLWRTRSPEVLRGFRVLQPNLGSA